MTAPPAERSAECALATRRPEYRTLHADCRRTEDIPLPHGGGILLQPRCGCACHASREGSAPPA
ncbi:hypothetical protein [Streptomyces sp. NPDC057877]|uniref:hypothetical protein n=1 Tax=Streptomyces sp. NPDC057877 TaxID=3346269 RepID=UPI0036962F34